MIYIILAIGTILRLISLNQSLWLDEATSVLAARMDLGQLFHNFLAGDFHPPLYYLILHYWISIFGSSEIAVRTPSIIAGIATVYVVYLIGKDLFDKKAGLIASLLLATSGLHIYYSQEARMYSLATLFVVLSVYFFTKILHENRAGDFVWFGFFLALSVLTDYLPVFVIPVYWLISLAEKKNFIFWKKFVMSHIILLIPGLFWLPVMLKQVSVGLAAEYTSPFWWNILGQITFKNLALIPVKFMIGRVGLEDKPVYGVVAVILFGFFCILLFRAIKSSKLLLLWMIVPILCAVLIGLRIPTLTYFRYLFILPAFYLLAARGLLSFKKRWFWSALLILLAVNIVTSIAYLATPRFQREDWRKAAQSIGTDKIVTPGSGQREALSYYGKDRQIVYANGLIKGDNTIWLSRYVWEISDPDDSTKRKIEALGYNKTFEYNFNGVVVWKYQK